MRAIDEQPRVTWASTTTSTFSRNRCHCRSVRDSLFGRRGGGFKCSFSRENGGRSTTYSRIRASCLFKLPHYVKLDIYFRRFCSQLTSQRASDDTRGVSTYGNGNVKSMKRCVWKYKFTRAKYILQSRDLFINNSALLLMLRPTFSSLRYFYNFPEINRIFLRDKRKFLMGVRRKDGELRKVEWRKSVLNDASHT